MSIKILRSATWLIILCILVACSKAVPSLPIATYVVITRTNLALFFTATSSQNRPTLTPSPRAVPSSAPLTATETQQAWFATAEVAQNIADTATRQAQDAKETKVAQFPSACGDTYPDESSISPDGNWLAASCGYTSDQTLVIQNKEGIKWVLDFQNFLTQKVLQNGVPMGLLRPKYWSPDGNYLYFVPVIGADAGGNDCFPRYKGDYGLFRLDLKTGSWVTLIHPTDSLLGYGIEFSPTGRRYVTDIGGITVTDLKTGDETKVYLYDDVEGFIWSPDGTQLAFTVASCEEEKGTVLSSSVYVWDALKNEKRILFTTNEMVLRPQDWINNSTFRISGDKFVDQDMVHTIYVFDAATNNVVFSGTATPNP